RTKDALDTSWVHRLEFQQDGKCLGADMESVGWDPLTGKEMPYSSRRGFGRLTNHSPKNSLVFHMDEHGKVSVLEVATRKSLVSLESTHDELEKALITPDSKRLVIVSKHEIQTCDLISGKTLVQLKGLPELKYAQLTMDGRWLVAKVGSDSLRAWD